MKQSDPPVDCVALSSVNLLPCPKGLFPTWCDVYIGGHKAFQNCLVEIRHDGVLLLHNGYSETPTGFIPMENRIAAIVHSNDYAIVARRA